jgi:hypothetical protein
MCNLIIPVLCDSWRGQMTFTFKLSDYLLCFGQYVFIKAFFSLPGTSNKSVINHVNLLTTGKLLTASALKQK